MFDQIIVEEHADRANQQAPGGAEGSRAKGPSGLAGTPNAAPVIHACAPFGVTATGPAIAFDSGSVRAGDGATLKVAASRETKPGTYLVTVTADGNGLKRSTELRINVHDPDRRATLPLDISSSRGVAG